MINRRRRLLEEKAYNELTVYAEQRNEKPGRRSVTTVLLVLFRYVSHDTVYHRISCSQKDARLVQR